MTTQRLCNFALTVLLAMLGINANAAGSFRGDPGNEKYGEVQLLLTSPVKGTTSRLATPASELSGKLYAQWDALDTGLKRRGFTAMPKLTIDDQGKATLKNFGGETCVLSGTYDAATSTLSIPSQEAWEESPYGTFTFAYFDTQQMGFTTKRDVSFTVQPDGTLVCNSGWCFIVADTESTFYGSATAVSLACTLTPSNASISGEVRQSDGTFSTASYRVYVKQTAIDELTVANFTNDGTEVKVGVTASKTATIEPQMILYNALTGPYCIYATNWTATKPSGSGSVTGEVVDNTQIEFGQWGVFRSSALTTTTGGAKTSMLTMDSGKTFSIPSGATPTFSGSGTASDPYLIKSADEMHALAMAVNAGSKYSGSFFKLAADIDFSSAGSYRPIGISATYYFDGTFDGDGHTLSNISIQRGASDYTGLFGYAGANSTIKNINVKTGYILTFGKFAAFIAGYTLGSISNCNVSGNINTTGDYCGGITGNGRSVSKCKFTGNIVTSAAVAGGIAGQITYNNITDCSVQAVINSSVSGSSITHAVGGVVGQLQANATTSANVERCSFVGSLYDKTGYAHLGGIAGSLSRYMTVSQCSAMGLISTVVKTNSTGSCGGVVGYCSEGTVENCIAGNLITGSVESSKTGGIAGIITKLSSGIGTVQHNVFTGQVSIAGALSSTASIYGKIDASCVAEDNWYDAQIAGTTPNGNGLSTSALTSGNLPGQLSSTSWTATAGAYPYPSVAPADIKAFATIPLTLAAGNNAKNVKTSFTIGQAQDVNWYIYDGTDYVEESDALKIAGNTVSLKGVMQTAYMVARTAINGISFFKLYTLQLAPAQFEGEGTAANPYLIKSAADIRKINEAIVTAGQSFEGDYFRMVNDIDMTDIGTDFHGIAEYGATSAMFCGTFDGNGKRIMNWKVDGIVLADDGKPDTKTSIATLALFSQIGATGAVKNLIIDSSCSLRGYAGVAGVAALSYGTIDNCRNYADITICNYYTAGIVARMMANAKTTNCYNAGVITSGYGYAAGIAADIKENSLVEGCLNAGLVQTKQVTAAYTDADTKYAGGIICVNAEGAKVSNCMNMGNVTSQMYTGGIMAGFSSSSFLDGCINIGIVSNRGTSYGGAMIGQATASTGATNCYYDKQMLPIGAANGVEMDGILGSYTSTLTSGQPLEGFNSDMWQYDAGKYPTLKAFAAETAANAYRTMVVALADGETVREMTSPATLSSAQGLTWSIPQGTATFSIVNNKLMLGSLEKPAEVILTATLGDYSRAFTIQGINNPFIGEGTEASPYLMRNVADMETLSKYTTTYGVRYENKYFAMTNDIDMSTSTEFQLIAWGDAAEFRATFDGRGCSIKNIKIERTASNDYFIGIFANIGTAGTIRNLKVDGGSVKGYRYVGAIAGNSNGRIEYCTNSASVETVGGGTTNNNAGGIAGYLDKGASVYRCDNYGKIFSSYTYAGGIAAYGVSTSQISYCNNYGEVSTDESRNYSGGIIGGGLSMLDSCVNYGTVAGNAYIGGIAGNISASSKPVINCENRGTIKAGSSYVGGIAGAAAAQLNSCRNYSDISGAGYVGGIAGSLTTGALDCVNYGKVAGTKSNYIGGVAGYGSGSQIRRCVNMSDSVTSVNHTVGGIVGTSTTNSASVDSCVNYAHVKAMGAGAYNVGGIAGTCSSKINDCINLGTVASESYCTAGISGGGSGSGYRNVNIGDVVSTFNTSTTARGNAAGVWGDAGGTISDCINYGNVTALRYCAGIAGRPGTSTKVTNCYFSGKLTTTDANTSGAIVNKESSMTKITVTNCYYNTTLNDSIKQSALAAEVATGLSALDMRSADLGDAYDYHNAAMPTLKSHEEVAEANFCAAMIVYASNESAEDFKTTATIPMLPGLKWSASSNILVGDGKITAKAKVKNEKANVYLKGGILSRQFDLLITEVVSVGQVVNGKEVARTSWFTLNGVNIAEPTVGEIVIEVVEYTDGTRSTRRVIYN